MEKRADQLRAFILQNVPSHSRDIVAVTASEFSVSRTTVHRHINRLVRDKKIIKTGTTNRATYFLFGLQNKTIETAIKPDIDEHEIWSTNFQQDFISLDKNIFDICNYGFTEIVNNAKDHSQGGRLRIETQWDEDFVKITIIDNGIGIFKKIKTALNLATERESILQLSKGKLTTAPETHTGEGIFFTSKSFDEFYLRANGLFYRKVTEEDDWFIESIKDKHENGTAVSMKIRLDAKRKLEDVFRQYTSIEEHEFNKTHILVNLSKSEEESYISRSQAKRVLIGLEKFQEIILDFKNVKTVGQGFVDEVFRIFKNKHPEINIECINANEDVEFMIKRGIPD